MGSVRSDQFILRQCYWRAYAVGDVEKMALVKLAKWVQCFWYLCWFSWGRVTSVGMEQGVETLVLQSRTALFSVVDEPRTLYMLGTTLYSGFSLLTLESSTSPWIGIDFLLGKRWKMNWKRSEWTGRVVEWLRTRLACIRACVHGRIAQKWSAVGCRFHSYQC